MNLARVVTDAANGQNMYANSMPSTKAKEKSNWYFVKSAGSIYKKREKHFGNLIGPRIVNSSYVLLTGVNFAKLKTR